MASTISIQPKIACTFIIPFRVRDPIFIFEGYRRRREFLTSWKKVLDQKVTQYRWDLVDMEKYYLAQKQFADDPPAPGAFPIVPPISIVDDKKVALIGKMHLDKCQDYLHKADGYARTELGKLIDHQPSYLQLGPFQSPELIYYDWSLGCFKVRIEISVDWESYTLSGDTGADFIKDVRQYTEYFRDHLVGNDGLVDYQLTESDDICEAIPGYIEHRKARMKSIAKSGNDSENGAVLSCLASASMNLVGYMQAPKADGIQIAIDGDPFSNVTGPTAREGLLEIKKNSIEYVASGYDGNFALIGREKQYISSEIAEIRMEWLWILATIYSSGLLWTQRQLIQHMSKIISHPEEFYKKTHKREELASLHFASMTVIHEASVSNIAEDSFSNIVYGDLWRNYQMESLSSDLKDQFRMIFERLQFIENEKRLAYTKQIERFALLASAASLLALTISAKEELVFASKKIWGKDIGEAIDYSIVVFMGLLILMGVCYLGRIIRYQVKEWWKHWGFSKKRNSKAE